MMGGIISEWWAASHRNDGRHHLGILGAITSESAASHALRPTESFNRPRRP